MKEETAMSSNVVFFGWNRSIPGREQMSAQHFQAFTEYLAAQQRSGVIQSFEPVFLTPHGGDLGGFILIRGDNAKLDALLATNEWVEHTLRATMHLEGSGVVRAVAGPLIQERMASWTKQIPGK